MALCSHCEDTKLYSIETIEEIVDEDEGTLILVKEGYCPKCNRRFRWEEYYNIIYDGCAITRVSKAE